MSSKWYWTGKNQLRLNCNLWLFTFLSHFCHHIERKLNDTWKLCKQKLYTYMVIISALLLLLFVHVYFFLNMCEIRSFCYESTANHKHKKMWNAKIICTRLFVQFLLFIIINSWSLSTAAICDVVVNLNIYEEWEQKS